jgi:hypothetical protein
LFRLIITKVHQAQPRVFTIHGYFKVRYYTKDPFLPDYHQRSSSLAQSFTTQATAVLVRYYTQDPFCFA